MDARGTAGKFVVVAAVLHFVVCPAVRAQSAAAGVKLEVRDGRPIVSGVFVNGHGPYRFLVDTGTNLNLINADLARSIGMNSAYHVDVVSASGATKVPGLDGNVVALGSDQADNQTFLFSNLDAFHQLSSDIRGVLGQAFLSRFDYLIDLRAGRLVFGRSEANGKRVPFEMRNGRPVVSTNLGPLVLDSGSQTVILFGVEAPETTHTVRTIAGVQSAGSVSRNLFVGEFHLWYVDAITVPRQPLERENGLLPVNLFHSVYVCNSGSYLVLN